ncbi:hypothetical protein ACEPPN_004855 [Leptodophora sp. 'Broadleaf-Isolate-01']
MSVTMGKPKMDWYTLGIALFAAIGTFLFGFDTGIATTTIAHQSWVDYMGKPSKSQVGAIVSIYIAGEAVGSILQVFAGDKLGRIRFMQIMCVIVTIGTAIQTAAANYGMFVAGRFMAGFAVGGMVGTVPVYLSEIAAPANRGLIGGISGVGISFGSMMSNWVGFLCGLAPYGQLQWRLPLSLQIPWGIIMFIGLTTFMPDSPRQLIRAGNVDKARLEFLKIRRDLASEESTREFAFMHAQIEFEMARELTSYKEIFKLFKRRVLVSIAVQTMTSLTGTNVVGYYQTILYKGLGFNPKVVLCLAGAYGTVGFISNSLTTVFLTDAWGRRKMLITGLAGVCFWEVYSAIMLREFNGSNNTVGKGFTIAGIYIFCVTYFGMINSTTWLYGAEVVPIILRNRVMGVASFFHFVVNVAITQAGPTAFANIHENYFYVFVGCSFFFLVMAYFFFPETKQKSLEEIAASFGDKVVLLTEMEVAVEATIQQNKGGADKLEVEDRSVDKVA